jgi:hypothetical protein
MKYVIVSLGILDETTGNAYLDTITFLQIFKAEWLLA